MHFASDTYVLDDLGYMDYPQEYFLLDGRLISAGVCYLGGILDLPLEEYIVGMSIIATIFVAITIYLMSNILEKILEPKNKFIEWLIVAISFVLILNQFTLEYLLFPESAVMCLGLLLTILALKIYIDESKYKYLKIFILLLISTICYQGLLNIFPILVFLIYILKNILNKEKSNTNLKQKLKPVFIDLFKLGILLLIILIISVSVIEIGKAIFESEIDRTNSLETSEDLELTVKIVTAYLYELCNENLNMLPHYINYVIILTTIVFLLILKTKKTVLLQYILYIIFSLIICIIPMFIFNTGPVGRVNSPIAMLWGVSLTILLAQTINSNSKEIKKYIQWIIIISFFINSIYLMRNISEHLASNNIEENMGKTIKYTIEQYEKETGIEVTKFGYMYDRNPQQYAVGIKHMGSLTERKFACPWSIFEVMDYYTERNFERIELNTIIDVDYTVFSEEQILFENDTVYLIVY